MKKTYSIEVDCANCANLMEEATKEDPRCRLRGRKLHDPEDDSGV